MLLNEVDQAGVPHPLTRRELRAAAAAIPAPPVSRTTAVPAPPSAPWHRRRPLLGGVLLVLGGVEIFLSGRLDLGPLRVQLGGEGIITMIIPLLLVLLGVLAVALPSLHVILGVSALIVALYSLVGVNLGGFILGMLLAGIGGVLVVAWERSEQRTSDGRATRRRDRTNGRMSS